MYPVKTGRIFVTVALMVFLSACATKTLNVYVGQTVADAMDKLGVPSTSYDMPDGTRAYLWQKTEVNTYGGVTIGTGSRNIWYSTGVVTPVYTTSDTCVYTMYAKKVGELDSPTSWEITGYKKPAAGCE